MKYPLLLYTCLESAFAESGDEEEADNIMNQVSNATVIREYYFSLQVLDEIGIDTIGSMARAPGAATKNPAAADDVSDADIERQLKALGL